MLQGYSEAILDGVTANDEERNEMVQIIHDESRRMGQTCDRFTRSCKNGIRSYEAL